MELLQHQATVEVSNSCDCEPYCDSECYETSYIYLKEVFSDWTDLHEANGTSTDYVRVTGKGMTWQRLEGHIVIDSNEVLRVLQINGDYRIEFIRDGLEMTAVRYSHDEPTGASFTFEFTNEPEEDEDD